MLDAVEECAGCACCLCLCGVCACCLCAAEMCDSVHDATMLAFDVLPRQVYLHLQLRLPSLYFSRVVRIYEDAAVSRPEIQRIINASERADTENVQGRTRIVGLPFTDEWVASPALARFKRSWEGFVDSLVREWKTLNVLSALLLSCRISVFVSR